MKDKKYTFVEYIAAVEGEDFNTIEPSWLVWANDLADSIPETLKKEIHEGDCTKQSHTCNLCLIETLLNEYYRYYFKDRVNHKKIGLKDMENQLRLKEYNIWECLNCGALLNSGIITLSNHWADCTGKEFMKDLTKLKEDKNLNIDTLQDLQNKHETTSPRK